MENREVLIRAKQTLVDKTAIAVDMMKETDAIKTFTARKLFLLLHVGAGVPEQAIPQDDVQRLLKEVGKLENPLTADYKFASVKAAVDAIVKAYNNLVPAPDR
jgi:hypothetical protein